MLDFALILKKSCRYPRGEGKSPEAPPRLTGTGLDRNFSKTKQGNRAEIKQCPWLLALRRFGLLSKTAKTFEKLSQNGVFV